MTSIDPAENRAADPIKIFCWAGIAAYIVWKLVRLGQGATIGEIFDFGDPSLAGLAVGACFVGLILRSPQTLHSR